jgi:hypothetical protein
VHTDLDGFEAPKLSNGLVNLTIVPELGGKTASIFHTPTQREWLWRNPRLRYKAPVYGASFVEEYDVGGLDECFPSVAPSLLSIQPWGGIAIPDHGESWCQPWDVQALYSTADQVKVALSCSGVQLPYRFERSLTMLAGEPAVTLSYAVTNLSRSCLPFVWSVHPLLQIESGMRIFLPSGVENVRVDSSTLPSLGGFDTRHSWPLTRDSDGQAFDLSEVPPPSWQQAYKLYSLLLAGKELVETGVYTSDGQHSFRFRFSPEQVTHAALWLHYGGWCRVDGAPPYCNLGLEPCVGGADSLSSACEVLGEHSMVEPRAARRWSLDLLVV